MRNFWGFTGFLVMLAVLSALSIGVYNQAKMQAQRERMEEAGAETVGDMVTASYQGSMGIPRDAVRIADHGDRVFWQVNTDAKPCVPYEDQPDCVHLRVEMSDFILTPHEDAPPWRIQPAPRDEPPGWSYAQLASEVDGDRFVQDLPTREVPPPPGPTTVAGFLATADGQGAVDVFCEAVVVDKDGYAAVDPEAPFTDEGGGCATVRVDGPDVIVDAEDAGELATVVVLPLDWEQAVIR